MAVGARARFAARAMTWPIPPVLVAGTLWANQRQPGPLFPDAGTTVSNLAFMVGLTTCWLVGVVLTGRVFRQPAGWAFLGLSAALGWGSFSEEYAALAVGGTTHDYPAGAS